MSKNWLERPDSSWLRRVSFLGALLLTIALLVGCDLVPKRPEAVLVLYRDRMKAEELDEARKLLSDDSRDLVKSLIETYGMDRPPENLALLNVLDPVTPPLVTKAEDTFALLQVRTLRGGVRLVRLVRDNPDASWRLDLTEELRALGKYLGTRSALDTVREQAGEYAASWKAFSDQLTRMRVVEPSSATKSIAVSEDKTKTRVKTKIRKKTKARVKKRKKKSKRTGRRRARQGRKTAGTKRRN
jgi:hypothetical protein